MLFLFHYCPYHRGRESWDSPSSNHPVLCRAKTHVWPLCCCPYWSSAWISNTRYWSNPQVPTDLIWARTLQECPKNPDADRAVQEVREHILRIYPTARTVSSLLLSLAVASVNSLVRRGSFSAREMITQRDQFTSRQLPISDREFILQKHQTRNANHVSSERSTAPQLKNSLNPLVEVGDLVYLYCDRNKSRNRNLVVSADGEWCKIKKFIGNQLRQSSHKVKRSKWYLISPTILNLPVTPSRRRWTPLKSRVTRTFSQRNLPFIPIIYHQTH